MYNWHPIVIEIQDESYRIRFGNYETGITQWHDINWKFIFEHINFRDEDKCFVRVITNKITS